MAAPKKKKEIKAKLKLIVPAGQANPAPPLGAILGQAGINIPEFCNQFNDKTRDKMGEKLPVDVIVYKDGTFEMNIKQPTVSGMLLKVSGVAKGSANPKREKVGKITAAQVADIAARKLPDLNTPNLESAKQMVIGTAKSLGLEIN